MKKKSAPRVERKPPDPYWMTSSRALQKRFGYEEASLLVLCGLRVTMLEQELRISNYGQLRLRDADEKSGAYPACEKIAEMLRSIGELSGKPIGKNKDQWLDLLGAPFVIQGRLETNNHIVEARALLVRCIEAIDDYNQRTLALDTDAEAVTRNGAEAARLEPAESKQKRCEALGFSSPDDWSLVWDEDFDLVTLIKRARTIPALREKAERLWEEQQDG